MRSAFSRCLAAGGLSLLASPASADEMQSTHFDFMAGAGYSSHPFVTRSGSGGGSIFGRLSADASHVWVSERTSTQLMGFWEGSKYSGQGMTNLVSLTGRTSHALSERLNLSALATLSADFSGQLSNRFLNAEQPGQPPVVAGPPPDQFLYSGRQYRADGQVGLAWAASERSQVSGGLSLRREMFSGSSARDLTEESANFAYDHMLSQRTTVGLQLVASRTDFDRSNVSTIIANPAVTFMHHLSEDWTASGSLGLSLSQVNRPGSHVHSADPSFSASICHNSSSQRLCASASHFSQSLGVAALVQATSFNLDWSYIIDPKQTVQLSAGYQHYGKGQLVVGAVQGDQYHAAASYSRHLNERLSVGADVTARRLLNLTANHLTDVSGSIFIRYRIGDRR